MVAKKILLLSVSAGAGHMRAAEAIRAAALQSHPYVQVTHLDAMDYVTAAFKKLYTDFYIKLVNKAPTLWGYLYHHTNDAQPDSLMEQLRRKLERMDARALRQSIKDFQPDAIVCTHFLPAEMLSRLIRKGEVHCPVWVQVTDFDLHRLWVQDGIAGKNAQALDALQTLALRYPGRLLAQGFTNQVERLMACADVVITKPGGLTSSECLAMGLPS